MKTTRYEQVAERILNLIRNGVLKEGAKIPSLRHLSRELNVSVNTVKEAYWRLENQNYIFAVPQSGYYVKKQPKRISNKVDLDPGHLDPNQVSLCQIYGAFLNTGRCAPEIELGIAMLNPDLWPMEKMNRFFQTAIRHQEFESYHYIMPPGHLMLRQQIARLGIASGLDLSPDDIIITNGCHEAIFLALMVLCKPGDTVVLECPVYFNLLQLLEVLNLRIIEIPSSNREGINLDTLRFVLENQPVNAMFSISNFNNPLGFSLPSKKKKALVQLLSEFDVPLIEDDIYGDIHFGKRPDTCKCHDEKGSVLLCSSFSKTLAPGLRVGWTVPGRYYDQILKMKTLSNIATPSINQIAVAHFLSEGGYERHNRQLRKKLQRQVEQMRSCLLTHLPKGSRVTRPEGGSLLWVELPEPIDTFNIYQQALKEKILIAPGRLFSMKNKYAHCFRINAGVWNERVEKALGRLGELCIKAMRRAMKHRTENRAAIPSEPGCLAIEDFTPLPQAEVLAEDGP